MSPQSNERSATVDLDSITSRLPPPLKPPISSAIVPAAECAISLGDNSEHARPSPWAAALYCVDLQSAAGGSAHRTVREAAFPADLAAVTALVRAYVAGLGLDLSFQGWARELRDFPGAYGAAGCGHVLVACAVRADGGNDHDGLSARLERTPAERWRAGATPPRGESGFALGERWVRMEEAAQPLLEEVVVGVCCVRAVPGRPEWCEIKRLYVLERERGIGLAHLLVEAALEKAKASGYEEVRLDTLKSMKAARRVYESTGFYDVEPYYDTQGVETECLGRKLSDWEKPDEMFLRKRWNKNPQMAKDKESAFKAGFV